MPTLLSIQRALARRIQIDGRTILSAIHKLPVAGAVLVEPLGLAGDEQADLSVHGGLDKALYAYPFEHYPFWRAARAQAGLTSIDDSLPYGSVGENLTLQGLLEADVWVGDVLRFAHCALRVTQPREPCYKFNAAMGFNGAARAMAQQGCCGFYLAVQQPGHLLAGEGFDLVAGPRRLRITESFKAKMAKHLR
ncbi:MAG: MOSC domain-containing protein [Gammaproteobacteria bacterium]|uniref:MOSC domain-containing protein n=1 Tax=Rhodoferax sp. TaxID=50421 RepID=UPI0017CB8820|nr:MOSC domain-containing protein [Rhodoferax sp.]MBU3899748.1 MOSC domain-containing protein [Gammaproteobacteria bacterium]MBA3057975.1 MOSC domain-containing protein [Rhodoferax sp.]MBU3997379.1 MOSC domain-containing protein [Gammaproteobacteria bacterium]MBU4018224.1 MOSC domain-containing protein [Gammaproteobacteria bacterium]MBU4080085.1 MOSC domain-containing protein [Gammaproteobacteria bacterium]